MQTLQAVASTADAATRAVCNVEASVVEDLVTFASVAFVGRVNRVESYGFLGLTDTANRV